MLQALFSIIAIITNGLMVENVEKAFAGTGKRCAVYVTFALIGRSVFYTFFSPVFSIAYRTVGNNSIAGFPSLGLAAKNTPSMRVNIHFPYYPQLTTSISLGKMENSFWYLFKTLPNMLKVLLTTFRQLSIQLLADGRLSKEMECITFSGNQNTHPKALMGSLS